MFLLKKPEWLNDQQWRTLRSTVQFLGGIFVAVFAFALLGVLSNYQTSHVFTWDVLWFDGVVGGTIAVLTWLMNNKKTG
jgi:hypothetical protein